jgi:hypothetical protein
MLKLILTLILILIPVQAIVDQIINPQDGNFSFKNGGMDGNFSFKNGSATWGFPEQGLMLTRSGAIPIKMFKLHFNNTF